MRLRSSSPLANGSFSKAVTGGCCGATSAAAASRLLARRGTPLVSRSSSNEMPENILAPTTIPGTSGGTRPSTGSRKRSRTRTYSMDTVGRVKVTLTDVNTRGWGEGCAVMTYEVRLLVDNFSVDNPDQVGTLFDNFDASAARICESTVVTLGVEASEGMDVLTPIRAEIARLEHTVGLQVVDVDLDLVDEGEIAARLKKSRQVINLYAKGDRGCGDFPPPYALPGGRRLWTWAAIARWVRHHKQDWDDDSEPHHLSREQQRELSAWLTQRTLLRAKARTPVSPTLTPCSNTPSRARGTRPYG